MTVAYAMLPHMLHAAKRILLVGIGAVPTVKPSITVTPDTTLTTSASGDGRNG